MIAGSNTIRSSIALAVVVLGLTIPESRGETAPPKDLRPLHAGEAAFWIGPFIEQSGNAVLSEAGASGSAVCADPTVRCFTYRLPLLEPGTRLRVAIDRD
jgi:hypothetical protein